MAESRRIPGWLFLLVIAVVVAGVGLLIVYGSRR